MENTISFRLVLTRTKNLFFWARKSRKNGHYLCHRETGKMFPIRHTVFRGAGISLGIKGDLITPPPPCTYTQHSRRTLI